MVASERQFVFSSQRYKEVGSFLMHANGFEVGIWVHGLEGDLKERTRPFATHYAQRVCSPVQTACLSPEGG